MWLRRVGPEALAPPMRLRRESVDAYWEDEGHIEVVLKSGWQMAVAGNIEEFDKSMGLKKSKPAEASADDLDDFEEFWSRYPRKTAKQEGRKAWIQTTESRPALAVLLLQIEKHVKAWQAEYRDDSKIPHAATWLRGQRWDDQVKRNGLRSVGPSVADMLTELDRLEGEAPF